MKDCCLPGCPVSLIPFPLPAVRWICGAPTGRRIRGGAFTQGGARPAASLTLGCNVWPLPGPDDKHSEIDTMPVSPTTFLFWATHNKHITGTQHSCPTQTQAPHPQAKSQSRRSPAGATRYSPGWSEAVRPNETRGRSNPQIRRPSGARQNPNHTKLTIHNDASSCRPYGACSFCCELYLRVRSAFS